MRLLSFLSFSPFLYWFLRTGIAAISCSHIISYNTPFVTHKSNFLFIKIPVIYSFKLNLQLFHNIINIRSVMTKRTGRMAANTGSTSGFRILMQTNLPAIDSKIFTDCGPLLSCFAAVRTDFRMPSDSVWRRVHIRRTGNLGAWSCLLIIIAHLFFYVKKSAFSEWVWEVFSKTFLHFC